jgi:hypothetical protein
VFSALLLTRKRIFTSNTFVQTAKDTEGCELGVGMLDSMGHALALPKMGVAYAGDRLHTLVTRVGGVARFLSFQKHGEKSSLEANTEERNSDGGACMPTFCSLYSQFYIVYIVN